MSATQRMSIQHVDPKAYPAVLGLQKYVNSSGLDRGLRALVDILASQINGCAWCLDMHTREAREAGVSQRRIDLVAAWQESRDLFTEREQAAFALTEQVTHISEAGVTDDVWERVRASFTEQETVHLLMTIAMINVWNRINVTVRTDLPPEPTVA